MGWFKDKDAVKLGIYDNFGMKYVELNYKKVLENSYEYSSFMLTQDLNILEAERGVAEAKGERGLKANLSLTFGLSQDGDDLGTVYKNLKDQEITGLTLDFPILD